MREARVLMGLTEGSLQTGVCLLDVTVGSGRAVEVIDPRPLDLLDLGERAGRRNLDVDVCVVDDESESADGETDERALLQIREELLIGRAGRRLACMDRRNVVEQGTFRVDVIGDGVLLVVVHKHPRRFSAEDGDHVLGKIPAQVVHDASGKPQTRSHGGETLTEVVDRHLQLVDVAKERLLGRARGRRESEEEVSLSSRLLKHPLGELTFEKPSRRAAFEARNCSRLVMSVPVFTSMSRPRVIKMTRIHGVASK